MEPLQRLFQDADSTGVNVEELMRVLGQDLFHYARVLSGTRDGAEDAVQDLLVVLLQQGQSARQIENPRAWLFTVLRRKLWLISWDNDGKPSDKPNGGDDTSDAAWKDEDPSSGKSTREIYDSDPPGCSNTLPGTTINHTAESYVNFDQYVTVSIYPTQERCSEVKPWSYQARVDGDKPKGKRIELNELKTSHITLPKKAFYEKR